MTHKITWLALTGLLLTPEVLPAADQSTAFFQGEPECLSINGIAGNDWTYTLKLVPDSGKPSTGVPVIGIHGLMHGTRTGAGNTLFYAGLTGTATQAPADGDPKGPEVLQISLVESNFGLDDTKTSSGLWIGNYSLDLNPADLSGRIFGQYSYTPIESSGKDPGPRFSAVISEKVQRIDCSKF